MINFKEFFKHINTKVKNISHIMLFNILTISALLIKTLMFTALVDDPNVVSVQSYKILWQFSPIYLAYIMLIFSFSYLLKRKQWKFDLIFNILYSILILADLVYFRVNRDFIGLNNILFPDTFNPMGGSLLQFRLVDIIFIIDIPLFWLWSKFDKKNLNSRIRIARFIKTINVSILTLIIFYLIVDVLGAMGWDRRMFKNAWYPKTTIKAPGPIGYHGYEVYTSIRKFLAKPTKEEASKVQEWLNYNNENLPDNEYKGIYQGKNVIFIQLESFENFLINSKVQGQEVTPFLNKLAREGMYFSNIHEQNNAGNTIDCDVLSNASIMTLGNTITAIDYGEVQYPYSIQRILKQDGYLTISTHAQTAADFNWTELHKNGFGSDKIWDVSKFVYEESVGYGLSDKSSFRQLAEKLDSEKTPFFLHVPTMTNHGPFNIKQELRTLNLPQEINESYLGGYLESARYTDEQMEMFFNLLDKEGIADDTVFVFYGDHGGVHKYYNDSIKDLDFDGNWWKEYTYEVPLIIYTPGGVAKTFDVNGGQVDIEPTVLYLLGVDEDRYMNSVMGRILVNTNRDATVLKGNVIKGTVSSEEEKNHLLEAYSIGDIIIKKNYFKYISNK